MLKLKCCFNTSSLNLLFLSRKAHLGLSESSWVFSDDSEVESPLCMKEEFAHPTVCLKCQNYDFKHLESKTRILFPLVVLL